ncbi:CRISPR system precrRNA processing endoribonuclease RAMP protein Cas6 [Methanopyrus sp.]
MKYKPLRFELECVEPGTLPRFKGFAVRGMLLRRLKERFPGFVKGFLYGDHPIPAVTQVPPLTGERMADVGDVLSFRLNLFGDAVDRDYEIVLALADGELRLGSARFVLRRVEHAETGELVWDGSTYRYAKPEELDTYEPVGRYLVVSFTTPTYIVHDGKPRVPRFHMIIRNAARKFTMLHRRFGLEGLTRNQARDIINWAERAETIRMDYKFETLERRSARIGRHVFRAIVGTFVYELPPEPPDRVGDVLAFAEVYGVGKLNTAGLGRFVLGEAG